MVRERTNLPNGSRHPHEHPVGIAEAVSERFKEATENLPDQVAQVADQVIQYAEMAQDAVQQFQPFVRNSLKQKPMATLASFVLVGFVLGALWKK